MMLNIACNKGTINLIQVYAPTADKSDEEIENFYADIKTLIMTMKRHDITMIIGHFNAKVGNIIVDGCVWVR